MWMGGMGGAWGTDVTVTYSDWSGDRVTRILIGRVIG